jgi:hypothetical protein
MFTEPSRLICIRVFDFYYYNLIHSTTVCARILAPITGGVDHCRRSLPTEALRRTNNFRMVTATPTMETKD